MQLAHCSLGVYLIFGKLTLGNTVVLPFIPTTILTFSYFTEKKSLDYSSYFHEPLLNVELGALTIARVFRRHIIDLGYSYYL